MRLWIKDQDHTPQRFPLQKLLSAVLRAVGTRPDHIDVRRVDGYGAHIKALADRLDSVDTVAVPIAVLDDLSGGIQEWFFAIQAELPDHGLRFGIHDSTAMFVEGDQVLLDSIASAFSDCEKGPAASLRQ